MTSFEMSAPAFFANRIHYLWKGGLKLRFAKSQLVNPFCIWENFPVQTMFDASHSGQISELPLNINSGYHDFSVALRILSHAPHPRIV